MKKIRSHTKEAKRKMSEKRKKYYQSHSPWNKGIKFMAGKDNPMYGQHHTKETKQKMRKKRLEYFIKYGHPSRGKHHSKKTKENISLGRKGKSIGFNNPNWKGGLPRCKICGKLLSTYKPIYCAKCKYKIPQNHPCWRGGISREPYSFDFNDELKELIRKRDLYKCQICGAPQEEFVKKLPIHHIDYNKKNSDPKNLITLCMSCHARVNFGRNQWQENLKKLS